MASDLSKAQFRGLLIPDPRLTTIWSAQSSFTQADPQPGVPEAQGNYDLALTASGDQPASRSYVVRTSEPGHPSKTGPASFMWKNEGDASTAYRGWDVPNAISTFMSITWSDSESAINPTVVTLDDQTVICAYHRKQNSGTENTICVRVMSAGSNTFGSEVELFSEVSAPSAAMLGTFGQHLVKLPGDRVLLYFFTEDSGSTLGNIRAYESTDKGATWSVAASSVLQEPISISSGSASGGATTDKLTRIRAAYGGGQVLLMVGLRSDNSSLTNMEVWRQYASDSAGLFFTEVEKGPESTDSFGGLDLFHELSKFDVAYQSSSFVVTSVSSESSALQKVNLTKIGSAYQPLTTGDSSSTDTLSVNVAPISSGTFTSAAGESCVTVSDDGKIYIYADGVGSVSPTTTRFGVCFVSRDDGAAIEFLGSSGIIAGDSSYTAPGGVWWSSGDTTTAPANYSATFARGRVLLMCNHRADPGNEDDSLSMLALGGSSTVTMPAIEGYTDETRRGGWVYNWLPFDLPGDTGYWTKTVAGSPTETLASGQLQLSGGGGTKVEYTANPDSNIFTDGLLVRFSLICNIGNVSQQNVAVRIRLAQTSPASNDYDVSISFSAAAFRVYDNNASSQIGSDVAIDMTTEREFIVAIKGGTTGSSDGAYQVWYRTKNSANDREWTKSIGSTTLNNDTSSASANNEVKWGQLDALGTSKWTEFHVSMGQSAGENITAQVNPNDLWAKGYSTLGSRSYVTAGTFVTAYGGPARKDDLFIVGTRYGYPISRVLFSESQTPRVRWRSTGITQQTIALALDNTILGADDSFPGNDVIGICLLGINWRTGELQGYNSGTSSWDTVAEIDSASGMTDLHWTREGGSVMPKATAAGNQYLYTAELEGGTFGLKDGSGTNLRKISTNTSGKWKGTTTQKLPTVILDGAAASDRSSGNLGYIMSPNVTVIAKLNGSKYAGYRLMIDAQSTVDGYFEIGNVIVGWVEAFGRQYSRGRIIETTANTSVVARTDGTTTSKNYGPAQRIVQFAWTDGVDVSSVQGSSPDPDYILGSADGSAEPIASVGDAPYQIEGIVRMMNGPDKAVVYLPSVDKSGNTITLNRRHQFVAGRLAAPARLESVVGDENVDPGEVFRVASVNIEEIV
tara:strand:+ start:6815 stop:10222 length:3408 start_codon:yes stop_codon:yes gene_type:complete